MFSISSIRSLIGFSKSRNCLLAFEGIIVGNWGGKIRDLVLFTTEAQRTWRNTEKLRSPCTSVPSVPPWLFFRPSIFNYLRSLSHSPLIPLYRQLIYTICKSINIYTKLIRSRKNFCFLRSHQR